MAPNQAQFLDGSDVSLYVGTISAAAPTVPGATGTVGGVLTFTNLPADLKPVLATTSGDLNVGKNRTTYRLFGDDGWERGKTVGRNWRVSANTYIIRQGLAVADMKKLEDAYLVLERAGIGKNLNVWVMFYRFLADDTYQVRAGLATVTDWSEKSPADNLLQADFSFNGEGGLWWGTSVGLPTVP